MPYAPGKPVETCIMPQAHHDIIERIEGLDIDEMTPRQAHDALYQLKKLLGGDAIE